MTVRVRLLTGWARETRSVGEEYDLPVDEARELVSIGRAEYVREESREVPESQAIERTVKARANRGRSDTR